MPTITITIEVPDGGTVGIDTDGDLAGSSGEVTPSEETVSEYWNNYLSENGRKLYKAAALMESHRGPGFTLVDIAQAMSIDYSSVQSYHRTSGRSARKWRDDTGTEPPIRLVDIAYKWIALENGMRTTYRLPAGITEIVRQF